ncbi:MAG: histidine phosphatase family protein [Bacteroidales bacterium]|nr:histidine phosphatase family protein [Bacteroidales bacterium]
MKEIIIMRHAKSDWSEAGLDDYDRPLNERGKQAAPLIAKEFVKREIVPDKIYSSSAKRAKETAKLVSKELNIGLKEITYDMRFYHGLKNDYIQFIQHLPQDVNRAIIIGHNPHVESVTYILAKNKEKFRNMTTAAAAYIKFEVENWADIMPESGLIHYVLKPKEL